MGILIQVVFGIIFMLVFLCITIAGIAVCRKIFMPTHRKYTNRQRKV